MRILTLNSNLKGVGTYLRCFYFSRELARAGHDVTMATVSQTSKFKSKVYFKKAWIGAHECRSGDAPWVRMIEGPNIGYKWLPGWGSGPLDIRLRTGEALFGKYDVIYGFEYQPNVSWPVYLTRPFSRYQFFSDWCDWHSGQSNHLKGWKLAHRVDAFFEERIRFAARRVTVISKKLKERALAIGIPSEQVVHLPEGVDTEYMNNFPKEESRKMKGLPLEDPIVVSVRDGDMTRVIHIIHCLIQSVPRARAIVIGNVPEAIQTLSVKLGIRERITFVGWVSDEDYPRYISAADVCLLPLEDNLLNQARFPAKLLDFLSTGTPVVTNAVEDVEQLVSKGRFGITTGEDVQLLATAVADLLNNPNLAKDMGTRARSSMISEWDWRSRGQEIANVVSSM